MASRGEYASVHTAIVDDPDFRALSPNGKLLVYTLKMILGASGIDVLRAADHQLAEATGMGIEGLSIALTETTVGDHPWVVRQGDVFWLRNGLKHNPHVKLNNDKHRTGIQNHINGLPPVQVVAEFAQYYGFTPPADPRPFDRPSIAHTNQVVGSRYTVEGNKTDGAAAPVVEKSAEGPRDRILGRARKLGFAVDGKMAGMVNKWLKAGKREVDVLAAIEGLSLLYVDGKLQPPKDLRPLYAKESGRTWVWCEQRWNDQQKRIGRPPAGASVASVLFGRAG